MKVAHFLNDVACFVIALCETEGRAAAIGAHRVGQDGVARRAAQPLAHAVSGADKDREPRCECQGEERARRGVFLGFQYPVEIPGVNNVYLLKAALNARRREQGLEELDAFEFMAIVREKMKLMKMDESFLKRGVNEGFSGGEKKRNEILQMTVLEPTLAILDETDSGLDIDALKVVSTGVNSLRRDDRAVILVTHYQRLLDYIVPDYVHVLAGGKIVRSGDRTLALELEARGYDWLTEGTHAA
jgi:Fe-S cluster assembly ATP-binding protein